MDTINKNVAMMLATLNFVNIAVKQDEKILKKNPGFEKNISVWISAQLEKGAGPEGGPQGHCQL